MALPAQSTDLEFQPGDHGCAFYKDDGGQLDDLTVEFISKGPGAENKRIRFIDSASSIQTRIPSELLSRENIISSPYYVPKQQFLSELL